MQFIHSIKMLYSVHDKLTQIFQVLGATVAAEHGGEYPRKLFTTSAASGRMAQNSCLN